LNFKVQTRISFLVLEVQVQTGQSKLELYFFECSWLNINILFIKTIIYTDIYNVIRYKVGSDNIIVVGGADWSWSWNGALVPPRLEEKGG
jgi:hypothetical protein